ncbi:hypothetical protein JRC04_12460 [Mycolicibacterium sp. S2-37]|uniref:hypothetical protein n=1 Tax=Mycolicibacterium sp. S2-37 TaxID=2810297 RepID=UPI001A945C0C|nr:hypothetical protein [Mycolicibacterium sp. S2-37]MBO0678277.1 hypothetical protein [Mycolicibacterium sp. S2-37]
MTSIDDAAARQRLSVPPRRTSPARALTETELAALLRVADCLIPASGPNPKASDAEQYTTYLRLALAARDDVFDAVVSGASTLADVADDQLWGALEKMSTADTATFDPMSAVVAGAYFMTPQVKALIGYPGQHRDPPPLELAADELGSGILDPVLDRGSIYVPAGDD